MTHENRQHTRGFTLIELLTVVSIIALLMGILMPSLTRARDQARKVKVMSQLRAISHGGLEMYRNDHRDEYPPSALAPDRITGIPDAAAGNPTLSGAHWLARAMLGCDMRGLDARADAMIPFTGSNDITYAAYASAERTPTYLEPEAIRAVRDNDTTRIPYPGSPGTGRLVLLDDYGFPILYYRSSAVSSSAAQAFAPARISSVIANYYQEDNAAFTGAGVAVPGWQYKETRHWLSSFGNAANPDETPSDLPPGATNWFVNYLHNHNIHETSSLIQAYRKDTFILISAGKDGIYGTRDDVTNFNEGL